MLDWARLAGFGALLVVALVGSLLWAFNYPLQHADWTCTNEPRLEQSASATKLVRCKPDSAVANIKQAVETADVKWTDGLIVIFTFALVIVGFLQVYWLKLTMQVTGAAAEAADRSARAAIGIELPIIRIKPDKLHAIETRINEDAIKVFYSVANLTFANLGRTKAFPIEVRSGMHCGAALSSAPTYSSIETFLPNLIFEPDPGVTPRQRLRECSVQIQEGDGVRIDKGELGLWFYCCLIYDDFMQTRHEACFCWRWTKVGTDMVWRPNGAPTYNRKT
jgi:hypothetical protein